MSTDNLKIIYDSDYVLGTVPTLSSGIMLLASSHSVGRMFEATVSQQQLNDQIAMVSATKCMTQIFSDNNAERDRMNLELVKLMKS